MEAGIETATGILHQASERGSKPSEIARYYGISLQVVYAALTAPGYDMGSLNARKVMRVEAERLKLEKQGKALTVVEDNMRYKGTRYR